MGAAIPAFEKGAQMLLLQLRSDLSFAT